MSIESEWIRFMLRASDVKWTFSSEFAMRHFIKHRRPRKERAPHDHASGFADVDLKPCAGFPVYQLRPREQTPAKQVLFLHGGSYVSPMKGLHWDYLVRLMKASPCAVTAPIYGLAPNHSYKQAYALVEAVYRELLHEHAAKDIIIMGDSSGGGLALGFAQMLRELNLPQPGGLVLLSPWLDIRLNNPDIAAIEPLDPILAVPGNREAGRLWAAGDDPGEPMLSPINGDFHGLAPICLLVGGAEILLPDARLLRDKAQAEGQGLHYLEYDSMYHIWMLSPIPEGRRALADVVRFMASVDNPRHLCAAG